MSNDQIEDNTITDPPFHSDHILSIFETNIRPEKRQSEDVYIRSKKHFSRSRFNRDLALTKWCEMYKETDADSMFSKFLELFETVLNEHEPIKPIKIITFKKQKKKTWITKEIRRDINQKLFFSINGNKIGMMRRTNCTNRNEMKLIES